MATSKVWLIVPIGVVVIFGYFLFLSLVPESIDDTFSDVTESIEDIVPKQQPTGQKIIDGTHDQEKADALFKIINEKRNWYGSGSVSYDSKISKQAIIAAKWYDENGPARGDQHHDPLLYTCPPIRDTSSYTAG